MPKKKWLNICLFLLMALGFLALASAITLYNMISYIPEDYHPIQVDISDQERINHYADKKMEELYNGLQMLDPFTLRIDQKSINELLMLSQQQHWFGENANFKKLQQPQISFADGRFNLMARVQRKNRSAVLTISIKPEITKNSKLHILLDQIKIGNFPIPNIILDHYRQMILTRLNSFQQDQNQSSKKTREQAANDWFIDTVKKLQPSLTEFIKDKKLVTDAEFKADNRWVQMTDLSIEHQHLQIKLIPQPN